MKFGKIDVTKIDKAHLFKGKSGTYLDISLIENRGGTDQYGNDGFITQGVSKEARAVGVKGPIIGNWKTIINRSAPASSRASSKPPPKPSNYPIEDDVPF
ncbi:MAG: hypothetical protein OEV64_07430 [Desulfobulbaceae bacterium]|nr:hypothetical protein [Desulfobulbaceae bacterium]